MTEGNGSTPASTQCCIVGGGPAGMMLGYLLARAGVGRVVLEKHADFLRDFRGDTVHPSTLRIMDELGLLDEFLQRRTRSCASSAAGSATSSARSATSAACRTRYAFIAMMPQWEFLDFLAERGEEAAGVHVAHAGEGRPGWSRKAAASPACAATAPTARSRSAPTLTVGCDGRHSTVRAAAGLAVEDLGAPIDVLWFRVGRDPAEHRQQPGADRARPLRRHDRPRRLLAVRVRDRQGRRRRAAARGHRGVPRAGASRPRRCSPRTSRDVRSWDDVKLLTVAVDRLRNGRSPGCSASATRRTRCRRSAASASTSRSRTRSRGQPARRQAARRHPRRRATSTQVRARRLWPTKATQALQVGDPEQRARAGAERRQCRARGAAADARAVTAVPLLQRLLARLLGMGVRPEHVESPAV